MVRRQAARARNQGQNHVNDAFSKRTAIKLGIGVSALALGAQAASAQVVCADGVCQITVTDSSGAITGTAGNATIVTNSGTITGAPAIALGNSTLLAVDNKAGGTITGTNGLAISMPRPMIGFYVRNAGTINGDVTYADAAAFLQFAGGTNIYIADGGTLNGNLTLGSTVANNPGAFGTAIFLQRGATTGVTGTINAGNGLDIFARSYTGTQSLTLGSDPLPATFEIAGYEALGAGTILTLNAPAGGSAAGFNLIGEGSVIVNGTITRPSIAGAGFPAGAAVIPATIGYSGVPGTTTVFISPLQATGPGGVPLFFATSIGGGLAAFTNNGTIQGDVRLTTAAFTNAGTLALETRGLGTVITAKSNADFVFTNTGTISQTYNGARVSLAAPASVVNGVSNPGGAEVQLGYDTIPAVRLQSAGDAATPAQVRIANNGAIAGGLNATMIAKDLVFANTGAISGISQSGFAAIGVNLLVGQRPLTMNGLAEEVDADSVTFTNAANATIADAANLELSANRLVFNNQGTISSATFAGSEGRALEIEQYLHSETGQADRDAASFDFTNAGTIAGSVNLDFEGTAATVINSGTVTRELLAIDQTNAPIEGNNDAFRFENESAGNQTLTFTNSGRIESKDKGSSALFIEVDAGNPDPDVGQPVTIGSSNTRVVNSGRILASGGALAVPGLLSGYPQSVTVVNQVAALAVDAGEANGGSTVVIENLAGGRIEASGTVSVLQRNAQNQFLYVTPAQAGTVHTVAVAATGDRITLVNSGLIAGSGGTDYSAAPSVLVENSAAQPRRYLAGAIHFGGYIDDDGVFHASTDLVRNTATGEIVGSIDLGDGDDVLENFGGIYNVSNSGPNVFLGGGNDTFLYGAGSLFEGQADGGAGFDTVKFQLSGAAPITEDVRDQFLNFERTTMAGRGVLQTTAGFAIEDGASLTLDEGSLINLLPDTDPAVVVAITGGAGAETLANYGSITGNILLGAGNDSLLNYGAIYGNIDLGDGDDTLTQYIDDIFEGVADGGAGTDTLIFDLTGSQTAVTNALRAKFVNFEIERLIGQGVVISDSQVAVADGGALELREGSNIDVGAGNTAISGGGGAETVTNQGTVTGNVDLGGGNNQLANQGTLNGNVVVGDGANRIANAAGATIVGDITAGSGDNTITNTGGTITGNIATGGGNNQLANSGGTINGNITTGAGNDALVNSGTVNGNVNLGGGNNTVTIQTGGTFTGTVAAGTGTDQLTVQTTGTYQAPTQVNGSAFTGFETLENGGGTTRLTGAFAGDVAVTGGYLFGTAGSTIAGDVGVGTGAQFGTSGTVAGDVTVGAGGTLAPGSSPGIMTVNGNVSLAAGSSSTFEFVPAPGQSDQLLISGTLAIGANTTLNMTGTRPLTPGVNYDVIVADGGITGTFATVNQPATIGGFLRYTPNRLQLMGTFLAPTGLNLQQTAAVNYVNDVLIAGQASAALLAAVPSLLNAGGTADGAAFSLLGAEAYASAAQLGVENGLMLAQAGRAGIVHTDRDEAGLFVFAQGMGDRRTLKGDAAIGTAQARSQSWGVLGGIGYGAEGASIGAFVGRLDSRQRVTALGARTDGDGMIAGLAGHFRTAGFAFSLLGAYDWTKVDTDRSVPGGVSVGSSDYRLRGLTLDASVGYDVAAGGGWAVRPEAGITHVRGTRGAARETGSAAFALDIDGDRFNATFVDGSIALRGGQADGAVLKPWLQAGLRHQIAGGIESVSAGFVGTTARFASLGAGRKQTVVTAGAGVSYDIGAATLYAAYQGEFGGGNGHSGNIGVRLGF